MSVYGTPKQIGNDCIWPGADHTAVCLTDEDYCLYYGKTDAKDLILQTVEAMDTPAGSADPADTGGL